MALEVSQSGFYALGTKLSVPAARKTPASLRDEAGLRGKLPLPWQPAPGQSPEKTRSALRQNAPPSPNAARRRVPQAKTARSTSHHAQQPTSAVRAQLGCDAAARVGPAQRFHSDITSIPTKEGFYF